MPQEKLSEIDELKIIYHEIISGATYIPDVKCYIKHLNEFDHIDIVRKRTEQFNKYLQEGIPSQKERIKHLLETGEWTTEQEDNIASLKLIITDNEKMVEKLVIEAQKEQIRKIIESKRQELMKALLEKRDIIGSTADEFCEKDVVNYMTFISIYNDKNLEDRRFESIEAFEALDEEEIAKYVNLVDKNISRFHEETIRKISALPFFINVFSYSKEDLSTFLKKPVANLTNYQLLLFSLGSRNLNILSQSDGEPPSLQDDKSIEDIVTWYDQQYSIILGKRKTSK